MDQEEKEKRHVEVGHAECMLMLSLCITANPTLRLGQIIVNAIGPEADLYIMPDSELATALGDFAAAAGHVRSKVAK